MTCLTSILWVPLLALGGYIGFVIGASIAGDVGGIVGGLLGVLASQGIQSALWGNKTQSNVPPPWWNR
jgi:hypothetical protein